MAGIKFVYFFGGGKAEGRGDQKLLLGGKGAGLAEMTNIGVPVPGGFTIGTNVCDLYYKNNRKYPAGLDQQINQNLAKLEKVMKKKLGDPKNPLLVSVRSGAGGNFFLVNSCEMYDSVTSAAAARSFCSSPSSSSRFLMTEQTSIDILSNVTKLVK